MSRYNCPFCSASYQFQKNRRDKILICGVCGEPLIKKTIINSKRIIGVLAVTAFISPLLMMIIFVLSDFTNEKPPINSELIALLAIGK